MKNADLDLDKRLNQKEFQMYISKNRDILKILDNYAKLLKNNPMSGSKAGPQVGVGEGDEEVEGDEKAAFDEEEMNADEAENDPDLMNELNRQDMGEEEENKLRVKEGKEFKVRMDHYNNRLKQILGVSM